ncbi:hypothetical protein EDB87DRAFT_1834576 [Lactarius vividus]|nr:hypothetical protein EDB87DRAFT_1834576 [Lactarius vividus]
MSVAFDVDLEMGHLSGKTRKGTAIDDYDFVDDGHYGGPQADAKLADGVGSSVGHSHPTRYKKDDGAIFKNGKGHIASILLFTGVFSTTVSLVILGSYHKLSPDPGEQTIAYLTKHPMLFKPSPPAVRATNLWFLSLGLDIICAIWAILWWQRYTNLLDQSGEPQRRARVRAYLFSGIGHVDMEHAVEAIWVLLHASVLFFFIGLLDFLFRINKTVACVFLTYIVPFVLVYIAAMLFPCFFSSSHYFTPSTSGSWKASQLINRRSTSQPQFRRPSYVGEGSWRDDREHRDDLVAVAHNASNYRP